MQLQNLILGLQQLKYALQGWKAKEAANDLDKLIELFNAHSHMSVAQFCNRVQLALNAPEVGSAKPRKTKSPPDEKLVFDWVEKLRSADEDDESFGSVLKSVSKLRAPELYAVAQSYLSTNNSFKRKADAVEALRESRNQSNTIIRRIGTIGEIF